MPLHNDPMDYYRTTFAESVDLANQEDNELLRRKRENLALDRAVTEAWIYADRAQRRRAKLRRAAAIIDDLRAERASLARRLHRAEVERDLAAANGRALRLRVEQLAEQVEQLLAWDFRKALALLLLSIIVAIIAFTPGL